MRPKNRFDVKVLPDWAERLDALLEYHVSGVSSLKVRDAMYGTGSKKPVKEALLQARSHFEFRQVGWDWKNRRRRSTPPMLLRGWRIGEPAPDIRMCENGHRRMVEGCHKCVSFAIHMNDRLETEIYQTFDDGPRRERF